MQVEALAVRLRPRTMGEAADLGVVLVHRHARSIARVWAPVYALLVLFAFATWQIDSWLPALVLFWAKPWLDRSLLFVLARAVFGESTHWADAWRAGWSVWAGDLLSTLTLRRLSPWRSYTQPMRQLEGQRGAGRRQRREQLLRGKRGTAMWMQAVFGSVELVLLMGVLSLVVWFAPTGTRVSVFEWLARSDSASNELVIAAVYAAVVFVLEPFYVAAGFAMYLNRRVELEAWDIEQEFRHAFA